ncbi:ATP-binding protein [Terasakiella pusilla]|uniref:ATP-binding protein n=1 Tax=Terasakiella pusilla TaxID=64973 RepID=UPI00069070E6|nr:ATP-binding protein [Terasakiella pusilla]
MGTRLLLIILLSGIFAITGTWFLVTSIAEEMLEDQARSESLAWAQFVKRDLRDLDHILRGAPPTIQDIQTLSTAKNVGNVIWFKIYDHDRSIVWSKDFQEIGDVNEAPFFTSQVAKGEKIVLLSRQSDSDQVIATAYLPIMDQSTFLGAIEVTMDLTHIAANSDNLAISISVGLAVLFVLLLIVTGFSARLEIKRERALKEKAQQAARARNDFIAMVSHELRTPLNGILGALGLIKENHAENKDETQRFIRTAIHSTEHLLALINEIIDFTQLSAQRTTIHKGFVDVHDLMDELKTIFQLEADTKGLTLHLESKLPDDAFGESDLKRLRQILFNLVSNAIKFTKQGQVTIYSEISLNEERSLIFRVIDTGIGMDEEQQFKVFERFHQVDNSLTRAYGGIGLGLSICRELAQLMGGDLSLESTVDTGSTFTLKLPFPTLKKESRPLSDKSTPPIEQSLNLLLVEDNLVNQNVLKIILEKAGHTVMIADNGQEAVEIANDHLFDLILMDIQMPRKNGVEATKEIRQSNGPNAQTPIVALSANILEEQQKSYLEAGMQNCLAKPIKAEDLRREVLSLYHRHKPS